MNVTSKMRDSSRRFGVTSCILRFIEGNYVVGREFCRTCSPFLRDLNVRHSRQFKPHQSRAVSINHNGVSPQEHAVRLDWVASLLKVQIPANAVNDNQSRFKHSTKRGNRACQSQCVKPAFLAVWKAAFEVLQGACHYSLAMAL